MNQNQSELGGCKNDLKGCEGTLSRISTEIYLCQKAYEEKCLVNMELKEAMLEEYNRESEKRGTIRVTTQLSIDKSKNMLAERERQLEDAQLAYCRLAGIDVGKRGIGYIRGTGKNTGTWRTSRWRKPSRSCRSRQDGWRARL